MTSRRERFFAPFLIFPMCGEKEGQTDDIIPRVEFVRSQFPSHCRDIRRMHLPESRSCHMRPDFLCEAKFTGYPQFTKYLQELFLRKNLEECCPPVWYLVSPNHPLMGTPALQAPRSPWMPPLPPSAALLSLLSPLPLFHCHCHCRCMILAIAITGHRINGVLQQ